MFGFSVCSWCSLGLCRVKMVLDPRKRDEAPYWPRPQVNRYTASCDFITLLWLLWKKRKAVEQYWCTVCPPPPPPSACRSWWRCWGRRRVQRRPDSPGRFSHQDAKRQRTWRTLLPWRQHEVICQSSPFPPPISEERPAGPSQETIILQTWKVRTHTAELRDNKHFCVSGAVCFDWQISQPITIFFSAGGIRGTDTGETETGRRTESRVTTAERRTLTASPPETGIQTDR